MSQLLQPQLPSTPSGLFSHYDDELMKLAKYYPNDFSDDLLDQLEQNFCLYIDNIRNDTRFASLETHYTTTLHP